MGIQISGVDNAEEARAIVREAKYPPIGIRGMSGMGPHTGYKSYGNRYQTEYAPWANENVILCPSIESLEGLKNVDAIAAVEGIDDCVRALRSEGRARHQPSALTRASRSHAKDRHACKKHGKLAGARGDRRR